MKVYEIPEGSKASKGRAIQNVLNIGPDDKVCAYINVKNLNDEDYINNNFIVLATKKGTVKKTSLEAYSRPRVNGVNAITIRENDELLEAVLTNGNSEILLAARNGKCVRFNEKDVRAIGRTASGVRGINIDGDDEVINVNLSRIPDHVQALVFTVNSFTGQTFATVNNAFCRLVNASNNSEVARYDLSAQGSHTALILAKIYRHNGEWKMHAIGETASGRTFHDLMPAILPHV